MAPDPEETTPAPELEPAPDAPVTSSPSSKKRTVNDGPTGRARRAALDD